MDTTKELNVPIANKLLAQLPRTEYRRLSPALENVALNYGDDIYQRGETISDVYFPNSGIVSLLATIENNALLEVGIVGSEGMIGLSAFLGVPQSLNRAIVQGSG